jgi:low affinity Fe/Cu permease
VVIRRVAPLSAARIAGLIYTLLGLPFALLVWIVSLVGLNDSGLRNSPFLPFSPAYVVTGGAVAVIVLPLLYGFF